MLNYPKTINRNLICKSGQSEENKDFFKSLMCCFIRCNVTIDNSFLITKEVDVFLFCGKWYIVMLICKVRKIVI